MSRKDIQLAIKIAGSIDKSLGDSVNISKKELRSLAIEAARTEKQINIGTAIDSMGSSIDSLTTKSIQFTKMFAEAAMGAGAIIGSLGAVTIHVGSDFESAFTGVEKTIDATDREYENLQNRIRQIAKDAPQTAVELSGIGEEAGQLGIKLENLDGFIKTIADLRETTNLGDEAASQFAKFSNIVRMEQDKFDELGSTVVDLGNNMATTEADIMEMGMRLAGAGKQINMTEADILGYAAALSSVGIEAEAGGSAMSKVMVDMQLAVEKGGERLREYARVANMSSEEFAVAFKENAAEAITAFIIGLNDTERLGKSTISVLDEMEIKEVRMRDTLLRAAGAGELFSESLSIANKAFKENTALSKEAEKRYGTLDSRLKIVKNRITDTGITLYQEFQNPLNEIMGLMLDETEDFALFDKETIQGMAEAAQKHIPTLITLYQEFQNPLNEIMGLMLDETEDFALFDKETIQGMAEAAQKHIPTLIKHMREGANAFTDFAGPIISDVIRNLDLIESGIVGIGTVIVTLNLIKKVNQLSKAFGAMQSVALGNPWTLLIAGASVAAGAVAAVSSQLKKTREEAKKNRLDEEFGNISLLGNPWTLLIAGASVAAGAVAAVSSQLKKTREEAKKNRLDEEFGNISLSLEELDEAARQIIDNGNIDRVKQFLEEMNEVSEIAGNIQEAASVINKSVWKIGSGFEFSEEDKENLKQSIDLMVEETRELLNQSNYAATIGVQALFGTDSEAGQEIIAGFNAMYSGINQEVESLGKQLGDAYSKAIEDGAIDIDEANIINELQGKLAKITAEVANSQFDAKMQRLQLEYTGKDLTAESFQNLQAEIQKVLSEQAASQNQSFEYTLGQLNLQYSRSQNGEIALGDAAYLSKEAYEDAKRALETQFNAEQMDIRLKGLNFSIDSINDVYSDEIEGIYATLEAGLDAEIGDLIHAIESGGNIALALDPETIKKAFGLDKISQVTSDSIKELWGEVETQFHELQQIAQMAQENGEAIPESVKKGLSDAAVVGALAGDTEALWQLVGEAAADSESYRMALLEAEKAGLELPEAISMGIRENYRVIDTAVESSYEYMQKTVDHTYAKGIRTTVDMYFAMNPIMNSKVKQIQVTPHAKGGIFTEPHVGLVAEKDNEAIIPLDGSENAKSIWQEAGEMLGLFKSSQNSTDHSKNAQTTKQGDVYYITFSPVLQGATEETLQKAAKLSFEEFKNYMRAFEKEHKRLSFG